MKHRILLFFIVAAGFIFQTGVFASEAQVKQAITSYAKYIEKAELNIDKAATAATIEPAYKRCVTETDALENRYDKYSSEIKENPEIIQLRERHLALLVKLNELQVLAENQKAVIPYERKINQMFSAYSGEGKTQYFQKLADDIVKLDEIYDRIPDDKKNLEQIAVLRVRHEELVDLQKSMVSALASESAELSSSMELKREFRDAVHQLRFDLLSDGKNKKGLRPYDVDALNDQMDAFKAFDADCKGKYSGIVAKNDIINGGFSAGEVAELAANREKYRDQLVYATYNAYLAERIADSKQAIEDFRTNHYIESETLNLFLYGFDSYHTEVVRTVTDAYRSVHAAVPTESFAILKNLGSSFEPLFNNVVSNNKWMSSEYESVSNELKRLAVQRAGNMGFELVDLGFSEDGWTIEKNAFGIPVRKFRSGYVLLKKSNENFYRKQYATFNRIYDGKDYEPASSINIVSTVSPVKK